MYRRLLNSVARNTTSRSRSNLLNKKYYSDITNLNNINSKNINTTNSDNIDATNINNTDSTKIIRNIELENQEYRFKQLEEKHNKVLQITDGMKRDQNFDNFVTVFLFAVVGYIGLYNINDIKDDIINMENEIENNENNIKLIEEKIKYDRADIARIEDRLSEAYSKINKLSITKVSYDNF